MSFPNVIFGTPGMQYVINTATQGQGINSPGTQMIFSDGRKFRWALNNASNAMVVGDLQQSPDTLAAGAFANHLLRTPVAAAVGDTSITLAIGATAVAADEYKDGYVSVELGTGFGYLYSVKSHVAQAGSNNFAVPIQESVQVAIPATATSVSLIHNSYKFVIIQPTTISGTPAGWALKPTAISGFGWLGTHGPVMGSAVGTLLTTGPITPLTTAGACGPNAASTTNQVGYCIHVATATNKALFYGLIDG